MRVGRVVLSMAILAVAGCGDSEEVTRDGSVERSQIGDTTVVSVNGLPEAGLWAKSWEVGMLDGPEEQVFGRVASIAVNEAGELFVIDRQAGAIRVFDSSGDFLETWSRSGQGPGELGRPDAGAAILPDERLVIRDRGNARMQVFTPEGTHSATWPVLTGQYINRDPLFVSDGVVVNPDIVNPMDPLNEWRIGLVRIQADGEVIDTVAVPSYGREAHRFIARDEGNMAERDLPFDPTEHWTLSTDGYVVHGVGDAYDLFFDGAAPMRLRVNTDRYPVEPELRAQEREGVLNAMRWLDPTWDWDGPSIPEEKPYFAGLWSGLDGRIWVLRETRAYETEDPDYDPEDPYDTEIRWRVDLVIDGFEPDGSPAGSGVLPRDIDLRVPPVLRGHRLWAVTRDELGVQRVASYLLGG